MLRDDDMPARKDDSVENLVETLRVVNTDDVLTKADVKELKKLASLSRTTRAIAGIIFGIVGLLGFPYLVDFLSRHVK